MRWPVLVDAVERLDEHLDGLAHLIAELVGDFLLVFRALAEHGFQRLVVGNAEEPAHTEQAAKGAQGERLFQPEGGVPRGETGRLVGRGVDQHPVFAVGDQPQPNVGTAQQFHHARGGRGLPAPPGNGFFQVLPDGVESDEQARLALVG